MTIPYQNTKDINQVIHQSKESLHFGLFAITPVNNSWVITYKWKTMGEYRYLAHYQNQQDAIDEVLRQLGVNITIHRPIL